MHNPIAEIILATKRGDNRYKLIFISALACIVLDQLTKILIMNTLNVHASVPVIPGFFNIVHIKNYGAAFGFLNNSSTQWQFYFFALAMLIALVMIYGLAKSSPYNKYMFLSLGVLLGGAIGNFIDRLLFRSVTDFLDFKLGFFHWPAFNVADIGISLGALGAMAILFFADKQANKIKE